ncbi:hypothetical protein CLOP_g8414, partial [Closterium sp. NIES-67]
LQKSTGWVQEHGQDPIIPFSGVLESKLADMPADEVAKYCKENEIQSGLPRLSRLALLPSTSSTSSLLGLTRSDAGRFASRPRHRKQQGPSTQTLKRALSVLR